MYVPIYRPGTASPSRLSRLARRAFTLISGQAQPASAPTPAPLAPVVPLPPVGLYEADEMPAPEEIEAAAASYFRAADSARAADRTKRAAKKILDRLPIGRYGAWEIEREPSGRQTVDLDEVRRIFKAHGLGPVPMKSSADSLKVRRVDVAVAPVEFETLAAVAR